MSTKKILWLEDQPEKNQDLKEVLEEDYFCEVIMVDTASKCEQLLKKSTFDVLILDLGLIEKKNSQNLTCDYTFDLLKKLRSSTSNDWASRNCKIFLMSAYIAIENHVKAKSFGIPEDCFIEKPIDLYSSAEKIAKA